eukprot:4784124-Heterocapsa_arctica.AAC.1
MVYVCTHNVPLRHLHAQQLFEWMLSNRGRERAMRDYLCRVAKVRNMFVEFSTSPDESDFCELAPLPEAHRVSSRRNTRR